MCTQNFRVESAAAWVGGCVCVGAWAWVWVWALGLGVGVGMGMDWIEGAQVEGRELERKRNGQKQVASASCRDRSLVFRARGASTSGALRF